MLHFSVLLQLESWWLQNLPCIIANAFNRGWEQFLVQIAHGSNHPTQLQHVPPSPVCLFLGWEGCFLGELGIVKGWSDLLKTPGMLPPLYVQPFLCTTPSLPPLQWGWKQSESPGEKLLPSRPTTYPQHSPHAGAAQKGDDINPFRPLCPPASRVALAPFPLRQLRPAHGCTPHLRCPYRELKIITNSDRHSWSAFHSSA